MSMKIKKPAEADLKVACDLVNALQSFGSYRSFPQTMDSAQSDSAPQTFNEDSPEDCKKAMHYLLALSRQGSLSRVVFGMYFVLDLSNKLVDPAIDTLEPHPHTVAALKDTQRLDWVMHTFPGNAWRTVGVRYSAGCGREAIDAAMSKTKTVPAPTAYSLFTPDNLRGAECLL